VPMRFGRQHNPSPRSNERESTPRAEAMTDNTAYIPPKNMIGNNRQENPAISWVVMQ
jgi:hypothetical protein